MAILLREIASALRRLLRNPGFTAVAFVVLALGIGVSTAVFGLFDALVRNPLPVRDFSRLVAFFTTDETEPGRLNYNSYQNWLDYRDQVAALSGTSAIAWAPANLAGTDVTSHAWGQLVSGNYFDLLGVGASDGRTFLPEEDVTPGTHPVLVLSHAFWQDEFGGDPAVVGRTLSVNGHEFTVIGVAQEGFRGTDVLYSVNFWVPIMSHPLVLANPPIDFFNLRRALFLRVIGRLAPGASIEQAQEQMNVLTRSLAEAYPDDNKGRVAVILPLSRAVINPNDRESIISGVETLAIVVGLILLLTCVNFATLLLVRGDQRRQELALRASLGCARGQLMLHVLAESVVLALLGGLGGVGLTFVVQSYPWPFVRRLVVTPGFEMRLDASVLLFALLLLLAVALVFGLWPALKLSRRGMQDGMGQRGALATARSRRLGIHNVPVIAQVALSLILLTAAGLFYRSLGAARGLDPGYRTSRLGMVSFDLGLQGYDEERGQLFLRQIAERVSALPGVTQAAVAMTSPLSAGMGRSVYRADESSSFSQEGTIVDVNVVSPGYFATAGVKLLAGRVFTVHDTAESPGMVVINETMARQFWPEEDALGKRFRFFGETSAVEVVGVVEDCKYESIEEKTPPYLYQPVAQFYSGQMALLFATSGPAAPLLRRVRQELAALDPQLPAYDVLTIDQRIRDALWAQRLGMTLLALGGLLGLCLAIVGTYGVMSYSTGRRVQEIGLRQALGAAPSGILALILRQGMKPIGLGLGLGLVAAFFLARMLASRLFGFDASETWAYVQPMLVLFAVEFLALLIPAVRAARIHPADALRLE